MALAIVTTASASLQERSTPEGKSILRKQSLWSPVSGHSWASKSALYTDRSNSTAPSVSRHPLPALSTLNTACGNRWAVYHGAGQTSAASNRSLDRLSPSHAPQHRSVAA